MSDAIAFMHQNYETIGKVLATVFALSGVILTIYFSARNPKSKKGEDRFTIESLFNTFWLLIVVILAAGFFVYIWPIIIAVALIMLVIWWIKERQTQQAVREHFEKCYPKQQFPTPKHHH